MIKHIDYRDKVIPSSFGDIEIDGDGNVTSDFKEEEQDFLLTIPGYYREGHKEEAKRRNDLDAVEQELLEKLPKSVVDHLPNKGKKQEEDIQEETEKEETTEINGGIHVDSVEVDGKVYGEKEEIKDYNDITVADLEKELKAEGVDFDKKSNKQAKYDLYVKAKQK